LGTAGHAAQRGLFLRRGVHAVGLAVAGITVKSQSSYHTSLIMESLVALVGFCLVFALSAVQRSSKPAIAYQ
jgi:hypothetical protein